VLSGLKLVMGSAVAICIVLLIFHESIAKLYAESPVVQQNAKVLILFVAGFHLLDALQCLLYFALRAWRITFAPMVVYGVGMWGVGVGGGWLLANMVFAPGPAAAQGFWTAGITGLALTGLGLALLLRRQFLNPVATVKL
jgi:MATE family multidrug resistance protein